VGSQAGTDTLTAFADNNSNGTRDTGEPQQTATKRWLATQPNIGLTPATATNELGATHTVTATVTDGNYGTLVKEVRVTLTARSEAANLTGGKNGTNNPDPKVRGSMTSVSTPRAALFVLSKAPTPEWR